MRSIDVALMVSLLLAAPAVRGQATPQTDSEKDGFAGPVKSISTKQIETHVNFQQPPGPALVMPIWCYECTYDHDGAKTLHGAFVNGKFSGDAIQTERDTNGHAIARTLTDSDTNEVVIHEVSGPFGDIEHTYFVKGKIDSRSISTYDQYGHLASRESFDGNGAPTASGVVRYDKDGALLEETERYASGTIGRHHVFDPASNTESSAEFDPTGRLMIEWKLVQGKLVHVWRDPKFGNARIPGDRFTNNLGKGDFDHFRCDDESKCTVDHVHFDFVEGDQKNPVRAEWRDADGHLLFAAYTEYEFDAWHNWTRREVRVWTPELGERALYETDTRTIEYWQ